MTHSVVLYGYRYSVYTRIARVALHEKGVAYRRAEVDPFADDMPADYLERHPFARVPLLRHGSFEIYETAAITRYIDAEFEGPGLLPVDPAPRARVAQVISIINSYGYRPMIRQVFEHRVFRPAAGEDSDETAIARGIDASVPVLGALNALAAEGQVLSTRAFTLADCHLAPMMAYFVQAPEGAAALRRHGALADWWAYAAQRPSVLATDPGLPR